MAFRCHLLVVANRTVDSPELLGALERRANAGPIHVTLLAPTSYSERGATQQHLQAAIERLSDMEIEADALLGDADPIVAVQEAWNPGRYDEVVVSTFPTRVSRWMQIDLPHRVARLTDCTVRHVESAPTLLVPRAPSSPPPRRPLFESVLSLMRTSTRGWTA